MVKSGRILEWITVHVVLVTKYAEGCNILFYRGVQKPDGIAVNIEDPRRQNKHKPIPSVDQIKNKIKV